MIRSFLARRDARMATLGFVAALLAAGTSLLQFLLGMTFTYDAAHGGSATTVRDLFVALNDADTVKIVFLAATILAVSIGARRSGALPRWFALYGFATAPLLALSGLAFPFDSDVLLALLELTLLLLLVWVAIFVTQVARRLPAEEVAEGAPVTA